MNKKVKYISIILIILIVLSGVIVLLVNRKDTKLDNNLGSEVQNNEHDASEDNDSEKEEVDKTSTNDKNDDSLNSDNNSNNNKNKPSNNNDKNKPSNNQNSSSSNTSNSNNSSNSSNGTTANKVVGNNGSNSSQSKPSQPVNSTTNTNNTNNNNNSNNNINNNNANNSSNNNNNSNQTSNKKDENSSASNKNETNKEEVVKPAIPTDENDTYRKKIESTYGITIKYGEEIGDYKPQRLTPVKLLDSNTIKTNLANIEAELKKYPTGFFRDFSGMPLTVYLVESVPNNAFSGFTDKQFMNDIKITVVNCYTFSYTLNHEIMHYIDAYLEIKMYPNEPYPNYISLNPAGFSYGSAQEKYNYGYNGQIKGAYFLNSYSQLDVREDRAEVFKQMMTRVYRPAGMFDEGEVLRKKALIISEQIKTYFPSAKGTQYWDKIIG